MRFSLKVTACVLLTMAIVTIALVALSFSLQSSMLAVPSLTPTPAPSAPHMFNVDLVYAYVGKINVSEHSHFGMQVHSAHLYPGFVYINYTYLGNPFDEPFDAVFEGYVLRFVSDTGVTASYSAYQGLELNQSDAWPAMPSADAIALGPLLKVNESFLGLRITDSGSFTSGESSLGLWSSGPPTMITLTVRRAGWWTVKDGSVSTVSNPESENVLLQVQLEAFEDGFLYNKLVPKSELSKMDPFNPPV